MVKVKEIVIIVVMAVDEVLTLMMEEDKQVMMNSGCQEELKSCPRQHWGIYQSISRLS